MRGLVNIIVLFPKQEIARNIRNLLVRSGFNVIAVCVTGAQVIQRIEEADDGLVICGYRYADMIYSELREYLPKDIHMLLLASQIYLEDCTYEYVSCLPMPLKAHDLVSKVRDIIEQISNEQKKKKRRPKQRTREEQKLIEEVKALLMENNRITEEEAHCYLQQRSMNSGVGLIEMAKMIKESFTYQN